MQNRLWYYPSYFGKSLNLYEKRKLDLKTNWSCTSIWNIYGSRCIIAQNHDIGIGRINCFISIQANQYVFKLFFIYRGTSWICQIMLLSKSPPLIDPLKINYGCLLRRLLGEEPTPTCQKWALCTQTANGSKKLVNFNCAQTQFYLFELFLHSS